MLKDLAAVWLCKDDGLKKHVGGHLARLDPGDHEWSPYNPVQDLGSCRTGIPARLVPKDYERSPHIKTKTPGTQSLAPGVLFNSLVLNFFRSCRLLPHPRSELGRYC